ncbi:MAG: FAD:protein FMN transferase, partial [Pseudomonadales bacterium]
MISRLVSKAIPAICLLWLAGCSQSGEMVVIEGPIMGTSYTVKAVGDGLGKGIDETLRQQVEAELQRLNDIFSTYEPDSELSRLNRRQPGEAIALSPELKEVLALSLEIHQLSGGAFDITVGPLVNLWGFGPGARRTEAPDANDIAVALATLGSEALELSAEPNHRQGSDPLAPSTTSAEPSATLVKRRAVQLDLSSVAKGYAVDKLASLLEARGASDYMIEIGGEVRARGRHPSGRLWMIGVEQPITDQRKIHRILPLLDTAMATSGDYRNYFKQNGAIYSHTLDPRTGRPITHSLASIT